MATVITDPSSKYLLDVVSKDFVLYTGDRSHSAYQIKTGIFMSKEGFIAFTAAHYGRITLTDDQTGATEEKVVGEVWWTWSLPGKRTCGRIVMEPTREPEDVTNEYFNRWYVLKREMCQPDPNATAEDCSILLEHLMYLAGGDSTAVMYFLNWLAHLYQFPDDKLPTAILMYSKYGRVGKSMLEHLFRRVFGDPLVGTGTGHMIASKFMDAFEHRRLIVLNELNRSDRRDGYEQFKNIVSEKFISFEGKGRAAYQIKNIMHFVITTNNIDALPLMENDGRILVMKCEDRRKEDAYYQRLGQWIDGPGGPAFAALLGKWQFPAGWDHKAPVPQTEGSRMMQQEARGPIAQWIDEMIQQRAVPFDKDIGQATSIVLQLTTMFPEVVRQYRINTKSLAQAVGQLGFPQQPARSYKTGNDRVCFRFLCWRNPDQWAAASTEEVKEALGLQ